MQHGAVGQLERLSRGPAVHEERRAVGEALERRRVGALDGLAPRVEPRQQRGEPRIAAGGRTPVHVHDGNVEHGEGSREEVEADVDDAWRARG